MVNTQPPNNVELYLPSVMGYEMVARNAAEAIAQQKEFSPDRIEDLKTAVAEACMNAIEHGNNQERKTTVTVLMSAAPSKLEVRIADEGLNQVPDELPEPGIGDMRGWGLFFIQQLMDEVEIIRLPEGGNQVRMVIYLTPVDQDPGAER
jgi:serine/threonine-protein kinase RsbW